MSENKSDLSSAGEIQYDASSTDDAALKTNDASYLLYYFCKSRYFHSVGEVLLFAKEKKDSVYVKEISSDPALFRLQVVLPETAIVKNIQDYCAKELELLNTEKELSNKETILRKVRTQVGKNLSRAYVDSASSSTDEQPKLSKGFLGIGFLIVISILLASWPINGYDIILALVLSTMVILGAFYLRAVVNEEARKNKARFQLGRELSEDIETLKAEISACQDKISILQYEQGELFRQIENEAKEIGQPDVK